MVEQVGSAVRTTDQNSILLITTHRDDLVQGRLDEGIAEILNRPIDCAIFEEIEFIIEDGVTLLWNKIDLRSYDKIVMYGGVGRILRIAHPIAHVLKSWGVDAYTSGAETFRGLDKLSQNVYFSTLGVPVPKTYFASPEKIITNAEKILGFPLILKDILSSQGERNYLVKSQAELEAKLNEMATDRYIAQQYIENDGDIRVLISADGDTFAFRRQSVEGTHLNNTSQGASAELVDSLSDALLDYCRTIVGNFGLPLLGIDVIERGEKYYFLEANTQPQILRGAFIEAKKDFFKEVLQDTN